MVSITMTLMPPQSQGLRNSERCHNRFVLLHRNATSINLSRTEQGLSRRLLCPCDPHGAFVGCILKPISAVGSGMEASIADPKENAVTVKNAKIVVESRDENQVQLRVDLPGNETQKIFDKVLTNLARTAPPIPGFRREKGGKTTKVPKSFLLQVLGEDRVTKFVIQEIVTTTIADYVKKENLNVKDNKTNTTQTAEELKKSFTPGNDFGFNAVLELEKVETEAGAETSGSNPP
ncbi:uncharacterized protein LOC110821250 isoform X2 [Carica papaya]|uniref:uncharacterized protein LOC110821250 isoform X2 n=1 Tax=Carica papaya TaxID=3649 RepID=UPI000B8D112C|nr:uncharacterized protein LOC110821250 isoform X2 [Carica papaya]